MCPISHLLCKRICASFEELEDFYFNNATQKKKNGVNITREYIRDLGQKLYMKLSEVVKNELEAIDEKECIDYAYNFVLSRTYEGYKSEINTIYGQLGSILGVKIEPAPDEWDRSYNVDFFIKVQDKYIGLQIKPAGYTYIPQIINEFKFQERTHQKFTEKYGGKVFYIISVADDKRKAIQNPEVIEEIKKEIERLG